MTTFCTVADVSLYNQNRTYDATSKPTLTNVTTMIAIRSSRIETALNGVGVTLPVGFTSDPIRDFLASFISEWADATNIAKLDDRKTTMDSLEDRFTAKVKEIIQNPEIYGITGRSAAVSGDYTGEPRSYVFQKNVDNW